jgi:hypothetical protein
MKTEAKKETRHVKSSECGATHGECPNAFKGSCDRPPGHDGSHHCDRCSSYF